MSDTLLTPAVESQPDFTARFPWCAPHQVTPAERHYALTEEALAGIAEILGDRVTEITFLRIVTLGGKSSKVKIYLERGDAYDARTRNSGIAEALDDLLKDIEDRSLEVVEDTPPYGVVIKALDNFCEKATEESKRDPKGASLALAVAKIEIENLHDDIQKNAGIKEETQEGHALDQVDANPAGKGSGGTDTDGITVKLFAAESRAAIASLVSEADHYSEGRLKNLETRIKKLGECRPLATVEAGRAALPELRQRFPNFTEFFAFLEAQFNLASVSNGVLRLPPVLMVGDPGIGKTEVVLHLAEILGTDSLVLNMASAQCGSALSGSDIHWGNSRQGRFFELLAFGRTANPMVMLDELDKMSGGRHQESPAGALYSLLERRTAGKFVDISLPGVTIDASHVIWFAAVNHANDIDDALLSRFRSFNIPSPTRDQMPQVIHSVYSSLLAREPWGKVFAPALSTDAIDAVRDVSPREIRVILEAACAIAAGDGRREVIAEDIKMQIVSRRQRIGF